jgi:hypothetical protein
MVFCGGTDLNRTLLSSMHGVFRFAVLLPGETMRRERITVVARLFRFAVKGIGLAKRLIDAK